MGLSGDEIWMISVAERVASSISLLSVLFVLLTYLFSPGFNKPINRQIFYATWSNLGICFAGLIGVDGYLGGIDTPLCRFQGFLVQMFLGVDAYWALCMAINVYLAFFSGRTVEQLRSLDLRYIIVCYGASFIPALAYLFVNTPDRGPIYGDASVWCWVSTEWDFLRLAVVYAIVWVALLLSLIVYIKAGRVIYKSRSELDGFLNPLNETPFAKVTEVRITHEDRNTASNYMEEGAPAGLERDDYGDKPYSVNIEAAPPRRSYSMPNVLNVRTVTREVAASNDNAESWLYARVAFLYFLALAITWIPSSVNRVYGIFHQTDPSFGLNLLTGLLLPLQGFWNVIVYIITSRTACQHLWAKLLRRPPPPLPANGDGGQKSPNSGEQSLISQRGGEGRLTGGALSAIKPRISREWRGRGRGGREFVDEVMMGKVRGKVRGERLGSQDAGSNRR
ncbi:hypothetical protein MMC10_001279 [Thelotrema lepadinum]|nr:hypothetical protein [Thelotrema lepadinum]